MKEPKRFKNAIDNLVKAFFNGTLKKGDCTACAVGNICDGSNVWSRMFVTGNGKQSIFIDRYEGQVKEVIFKTGYHWKELARVEEAFETNTKIHFEKHENYTSIKIMEDQFNGLMSVVDVLCEIEGLDKEPYRRLFEYNNNLEPVNS